MSTRFNLWIKKSQKKFGLKFENLQNGIISIDKLQSFESPRIQNIIKELENKNATEISFADLFLHSKEDMLIPCPKHGLVCMTPARHIESPTGCTKCSGKYQRTTEEFDKELKETFGKNISRIDPYKNQKTPMRMLCTKHGEFPHKKTGSDLLNGHQGCPECQKEESSLKRRWKKEEWIEKANQIFLIPKDNYSGISLEIVECTLWVHDLFCIVHQKYYCQRANDHHKGHRCSLCGKDILADLFRLSYTDLIQRCKEKHKEEKYEWGKEPDDYKNGYSKIPVICHATHKDGKEHGIWYPSAHNHVNGSKCPLCKTVGYSKIAIEWITSLSLKLGVFIQHMENGGEYKISNSYKADGYSSELNCIFEFHGCHVHGCKSCYPNRDELDLYERNTHEENYQNTLTKKKFCIDQGYKYIEIWYCEWKIL